MEDETLACGTGATACAIVTHLLQTHLLSENVHVQSGDKAPSTSAIFQEIIDREIVDDLHLSIDHTRVPSDKLGLTSEKSCNERATKSIDCEKQVYKVNDKLDNTSSNQSKISNDVCKDHAKIKVKIQLNEDDCCCCLPCCDRPYK